jgi:oxalate---CoA ligase
MRRAASQPQGYPNIGVEEIMDIVTIPQLLQDRAERAPEALALLAPSRVPLTYGRLAKQLAATIARLNELGVGRNDRVAIVLPNGAEMALAFLAVAGAATSAPLNPAYSASEVDFYLTDLQARALVVMAGDNSPAVAVAAAHDIPVIRLAGSPGGPAGLFSLVGEGRPRAALVGPAQPDDLAVVVHTSGTTSRPKIVPLRHRALCAAVEGVRQSLQLAPDDRCLNVMPLFYLGGLAVVLLASLAAGSSVVCTPGFHAPQFFSWLETFQPTWYHAVPTMHQAILARAAANAEVLERSHLRFVRSSSAALPPKAMADLERTFRAPVIEAYGMTEAPVLITSNPLPPRAHKPGSVGVPVGPEMAIMAEEGERLLATGEVGEVVIRGPNVWHGDGKNPKADAKTFAGDWLRTGDQGYIDEDGYLFLTGRLREIINRGGEKVSPREVEDVLTEHPAVAQAVAFALPDVALGQDIAAVVTLREPGTTEGELRRFVSQHLAPFKVPRRVAIVDEIPKGSTGKVQRIGLAKRLGMTLEPGAPAPEPKPSALPSSETEKLLAQMWCEVLSLPSVGSRDRFLDLGGDSILATQLVARLRQLLSVDLTLLDFFDAPTIAQQAAIVDHLRAGRNQVSTADANERNDRETWVL